MSNNRTVLRAGDPAPNFSLSNQDGETVQLESLRGSRVILFFYPEAMTAGCTKQACDFRDSEASLAAAGYTIFGISPDDPEKLRRFRERDSLTFDLLSDPERKTMIAYGAFGEKNLYGRIVEGVIRSTFVINKDGMIEHALVNVRATGHVARLRKLLGLTE